MLALFIPQYIRTCLSKQNLFGSYTWVMGYFHKADYIFLLFTQLVNESCALHTAMVFMAWKLLWHTYKCSWSCGALIWIKEPSTAPITQDLLLFCKSQPLLPVGQEQNIQCLLSLCSQKELPSAIEIPECNLCCNCSCFWTHPLNS